MAVLIAGPEVLETVAVNVTDCPKTDGFTEEVTVVEVGAGLTVWLRVPELPLKPPSVFVYTALMVCGEPLTVRAPVAPLVAVAAAPDQIVAQPRRMARHPRRTEPSRLVWPCPRRCWPPSR